MNLERLQQKLECAIKGLVNVCVVTNTDDDEGLDSVVQVTFKGKPMNVVMYMPYGMSANIPLGATIMKFLNNGSVKSPVGMPSFPENRFRGLKPWEIKFGNFKTKANIFFDKDGNIVFHLDNEKPSEDFMVRFNALEAGVNQIRDDNNANWRNFLGHQHTETTGNPTTAIVYTPPAVAPTQSTASIAAAKISAIRVPTND